MAKASDPPEIRFRAQQAKEFLIAQIIEEAQKENVPLSEIERKMLHFTECEGTLPDIMEVSDQFDREYDSDEYETKIANLFRNAYQRATLESPLNKTQWKSAIADLRKEDHYLVIMINEGLEPAPSKGWYADWGLGWTIALILFVLLIIFVAVMARLTQ